MMASRRGRRATSTTAPSTSPRRATSTRRRRRRAGFMPRVGLAWRLDDEDRGPRRLRPLRHADLARQLRARHPRRDRPRRPTARSRSVLPDAQRRSPQAYLANPFPQGLTPTYGKSYGATRTSATRSPSTSTTQRTPDQRPHQRLRPAGAAGPVRRGRHLLRELRQPRPVQQEPQHDGSAARVHLRGGARRRRSRTRSTTTGRSRPSPARCAARRPSRPASCCAPTRSTATSSRPAPTCARRATSRCSSACSGRSPTGISFLATYAYVAQKSQWYYDPQDEYDGMLTWLDFSVTQAGRTGAPTVIADPKHRFVGAATVEHPGGQGTASRVGHVAGPRRDRGRLAGLRHLHLHVGRAADLRYHDGPDVGREDRRGGHGQVLVRHHGLHPPARLHAAQQPLVLRRPHRPELQEPRPRP